MLQNHIFDYKDYIADRERTFRVHREPFDVEEAVMEVVGMFEGICRLKNIKIDVELSNTVPSIVMSDKQRIQQVLRNYISNALKFSFSMPYTINEPHKTIKVKVYYEWQKSVH